METCFVSFWTISCWAADGQNLWTEFVSVLCNRRCYRVEVVKLLERTHATMHVPFGCFGKNAMIQLYVSRNYCFSFAVCVSWLGLAVSPFLSLSLSLPLPFALPLPLFLYFSLPFLSISSLDCSIVLHVIITTINFVPRSACECVWALTVCVWKATIWLQKNN